MTSPKRFARDFVVGLAAVIALSAAWTLTHQPHKAAPYNHGPIVGYNVICDDGNLIQRQAHRKNDTDFIVHNVGVPKTTELLDGRLQVFFVYATPKFPEYSCSQMSTGVPGVSLEGIFWAPPKLIVWNRK